MNRITGIGACVYDTLIRVPHYPEEDTKLRAWDVVSAGGGPVATGLVAAAKLGGSCAYIGVLALDSAGDYLEKDFRRYGVETDLIERLPGSSFTSTVLLAGDSKTRTCVFDRGTVYESALSERQLAAVRACDVLMVDGNNLASAVKAAEAAREAGVKVLYDAGGLYDGVEKLIRYADYLIPSEEFALGFTGEKSAEAAAKKLYEKYAPHVVVVTQGKNGGIFFCGSPESYPAFKVDAADTNGSGDVFHGAFAYFLSAGFSVRDCCKLSSAVSALKCTRVGSRQGAPSMAELKSFLAERRVTVQEIPE